MAVEMNGRKIFAMHKRFGTCGAFRCKDCDHLIGGKYHDRQLYKCELYGLTHSEATDWRLSYQACGMYNMEVDERTFVPVFQQVLHERRPKIQEPLAGQMDFSAILNKSTV